MSDDQDVDLVVVGAGVAGLAAAHYWRTEVDPHARILILERSHRLGGPAIAHHFEVDGHRLVSPGGAQDLTFPSSFAAPVHDALTAVGIDLTRFASATVPGHYARLGAGGTALAFPASVWGRAHVATIDPDGRLDGGHTAPVSRRARAELSALFDAPTDWLADRPHQAKLDTLGRFSCAGLLREFADLDEDVHRVLRHSTSAQSGMTFDQHPALDATLVGYLGLDGIDVRADRGTWAGLTRTGRRFRPHLDPPIFRYPDGNATVATALAAHLIPGLFAAADVDTRLTEEPDPRMLDHPDAAVRIHLGSTVRCVEHIGNVGESGNTAVAVHVDTADGSSLVHRAGAVVLTAPAATTAAMIPELTGEQRATATRSGRYPMVSASLALRDWRAWQRLGVHRLWWTSHPTWQLAALQFPVALGPFQPPTDPGEPVTATVLGALTAPDVPAAAGAAAGRARLRATSPAALADELRGLLAETLGPAGLDLQRDLVEVRVQTWPDGYARYGTSRDVPGDGSTTEADKARLAEGIGRIAIAGVDVIDHPFLDGAMESAHLAVHVLAGRIRT